MSDIALIPFGLRVDDGSIIDVCRVKKGSRCGCICPSCETPLIARQGEKKVWHFAHASRAVYEETEKECEYSFFVSVRLMARQVIGRSLKIETPQYEDSICMTFEGVKQPLTERFLVTKRKTVEIDSIEIEQTCYGVVVDVFGYINGYAMIIYLTHPGRDVPQELQSPGGKKCGVLRISLDKTFLSLMKKSEQEDSYLDRLRLFLEKDVESKCWVYHPRYSKARERAEEKLRSRAKVHSSTRNMAQVTERSGAKGLVASEEEERLNHQYECVMCNTTWVGSESANSACPECKTHVYRKIIVRKGDVT